MSNARDNRVAAAYLRRMAPAQSHEDRHSFQRVADSLEYSADLATRGVEEWGAGDDDRRAYSRGLATGIALS